MVEEKQKERRQRHQKPSNLQLERSLSVRSQTSDCCNADLSPGVPNNEKCQRPAFQSMMSREQTVSLMKPESSVTALRDSAASNLSPTLLVPPGGDAGEEAGGGQSPAALLDNMRTHHHRKHAELLPSGGGGGCGHVVLEMAEGLEKLKQRRDAASETQKQREESRCSMLQRSLSRTYHRTSHRSTTTTSLLRQYGCLAVAFVVMLLIISAVLTGVFFTINQAALRDLQAAGSGGEREFCLPCEDLRLSSDPRDDVTGEFSVPEPFSTPLLCCAHTSAQIMRMIELRVDKKLAEQNLNNYPAPQPPQHHRGNPGVNPGVNPGSGVTLPPLAGTTTTGRPLVGNPYAAQVYLENLDNSGALTGSPSYSILYGWGDEYRATSFVKKGIEFNADRGRLKITKAGIYHVTLNLVYYPPYDRSSTGRDQEFHTILVRDNVKFGNQEELFSNHHRRDCDVSKGHTPCYTATLTGDVLLRAGDELFVKVLTSSVEQNLDVELNDESNYLGIHYIDFSE